MPAERPSEIESGLIALRRRIRQIQLLRGLFMTGGVLLGGILVIIAFDYFLAPLASWLRAGLFFLWLAVVVLAVAFFILRPLMRKLPLLRLARWLEARHPETEERISSALELSGRPEGLSPDLLAELSQEAASDMSMLDPREEVETKRIRGSILPVGGALIVLVSLAGLWPREMGRLLTRAVSPFSELGNAGAFRFEVQPGDVELLAGDELSLDLVYTGSLKKPLELILEKEGEKSVETLQPTRSDGETHYFSYQIHSADDCFKYSARVAGNESDRFKVRVYPLPSLLEPTVTLRFPPYTFWPDREFPLEMNVRALAGTEVTVRGRFETPLESAELLLDSSAFGEVSLDPSARGTDLTWSGVVSPELSASALLKVKHRLGQELDAAQFHLQALEDPAPVVKILTPVQREFRVKPDEEVVITYEVVERIGLAKAEIELEVNGKLVPSLPEFLPERSDGEAGSLWMGEARVFLGSLVSQYHKAKVFRIRLALSDNRPADLDGPGLGYSEWLEFKLDENAESLVRQELRKQDSDIRESIDEAIREVEKAKQKMHKVKAKLHKDEVSEQTEKTLTDARERLQDAQKQLRELSKRMKQGVQEHRRDELEAVIAKLEEAKKAVGNTVLKDSLEARHAEMDHALRESQEAVQDLHALKNEVQKDQAQTNDLARLHEMAQKQEALARQAAEKEPDQDWKNKQRQMQEEIRQKVQQSPEAKAAAMKSQSERALDLAEEAKALQESQEELAMLAEPMTPGVDGNQLKNALAQALAREQEAIVKGTKAELSAARESQEARANDLPEALAQAEEVLRALEGEQEEGVKMAAESAQQAAREMMQGAEVSPSQMALQEKQQGMAEALKKIAEGRPEEALAALEEMQAARSADLAQDIQSIPEVEGNTLAQARQQATQGAEMARQASKAQQSGQASQASQQHERAALKFEQASESLALAAQKLSQRAEQVAQKSEDSRKAPAPGEEMAEALGKSAEAANASEAQQAATSAKAAAEALRQAAEAAKNRMRQGGKPGEEMAQGNEPGEPGQGDQLAEEAEEGIRENQEGKGIPPELAKLGMSVSDWEKIQAIMKTDVGGSRRSVLPDDYRGLVKKYFEQVTKKR